MILEKKFYKKIESYLYNLFEKNEQLEIRQEDAIYGSKSRHLGEEIGGSMAHDNESKVESAALKLLEIRESQDAKWTNVINDAVREFQGTEYEKLIDLTYNKQYQMPKILRLLSIERTGYYDRKNDVIIQIALKASAKGLIDNKIKKSVGEK